MINYKLKDLFARRFQQKRWVYILAAIPVLFIALWGQEYGAFLLYFSVGALCLVQFFYPTLSGWGLLFAIYLIGAGSYVYVFIRDLFHLILGTKSAISIFVDLDDSIFFTIFITCIVAIAFGLFKIKPKQIET
jgi:hypothetical protein